MSERPVIPEPTVSMFKISELDEIFIASDGVYEVNDFEFWKFKNLTNSKSCLQRHNYEKSRQLWSNHFSWTS